ncbi:unnamed protein product [Adineta ricciae]|uniref:Protein unc-45 homolog B n=1 Tax=Adineta ricciae TaxID=249248 RepID=A0A814CMV4_ADIRI|nr:unnamed protein product [Adineta ricciae]CAF0946753.1 unnamed protein product [Adineta ricciae]
MSTSSNNSNELREQGNQAFKQGQFQQAIDRYTDALDILNKLQINEEIKNDITKCYSNRSQCYINLEQYDDAIEDATRALEYTPADQKSLYRRANAFERSGRLKEAISDAQRLISITAKGAGTDEQTYALLRKLRESAQSKVSEQTQVNNQVQQMFETILSKPDQLETALNNLLVVSREVAGAEAVIAYDTDLQHLTNLIQRDDRISVLGTLRILSALAKNSYKRAENIYNKVGLKLIARCLAMDDAEIPTNAAILIHNMLMSICDLENRRKVRKPMNVPYNFDQPVIEIINEIFRMLLDLIDNKACSGVGRDCCLDLIVKFVDRANGCNWTSKFIISGLPKVLRVAATVPELPETEKKHYPLTAHTKMHISMALSIVYHDLVSDKEREDFNNECMEFVKALRERDDMQSRVRTISVLSTLLQGPFDTGNAILGSQNLVDLMITMAGSGDPLQERIAVEAIVLSASKKDKAAGILSLGSEILKNLYQSANEQIKVIALVGLSKIASSKGTDSAANLVTEGSCQTLALACCKFLTTSPNFDIRRWAADGLAYLTLDADVKEDLVDNTAALKALFSLCQCDDAHVLYSITTIFVNLTNTYDTRKKDKQMEELATYAKQHIPKEHEKDAVEFFEERRRKLVDAGIIPVLVQLCKHKSENCREQVARVFLGLCENEKYRGPIVAAGGAKALLPLALDGTQVGKTKAAQALAKIAITTNPENAFPGQRTLELVRPILKLLKLENTSLETFEALMALTNLAGIGESVRKRILKEQGFPDIEQYMYEDHRMLRRAATECMCNLVSQEEVVKLFTAENDRIKLMVLLCGEEDEPLVKAALGTLAILSSLQVDLDDFKDVELAEEDRKKLNEYIEDNRIICEKILNVQSFTELFKHLCASTNFEVQFRALYILRNLVKANKELASRIVASELMDVLFAIKETKDEHLTNDKNRKVVSDILQLCLKYGLIQPNENLTILEEDETDA